ncbi:double zinc ribbon domain-containing protein [Erythrobacter sp. MTPC3]|uniref:double zinc ribbon domain-containing protein n=1 Tax=Erythrobacter sp. MTPC3 TaxID=3056564 RepID=UPI0036F233F9
MDFRGQIAGGLKPIVDLIYPPRCPLCGDAVADQGGLCSECWGGLEFPSEPACSACARPIGQSGNAPSDLCFACVANPPRHSGVYAATLYNDASRRLILSFKHGGKIALSGLLSRMIANRIPPETADMPLLVPVPLHRTRLWSRGYNQAALIARELEKLGRGGLAVDALRRHRRTPSLGGLGKEARAKALQGAISVVSSRAKTVAGRNVILVDDVLTSGATSDACVAALLDAGANSVRVACFSRVVDG